MRHVLVIPLEEVRSYFETNERQSLKVVAPARLGGALLEQLRARGVDPKPELPLDGRTWHHSPQAEPNRLVETREFAPTAALGGFTIAFGNQVGPQEEHVHRQHAEIYYSESRLEADYRVESDPEGQVHTVELAQGGALVFAPGVVHRVRLGGITIVIEMPCMEGDKFNVQVAGRLTKA